MPRPPRLALSSALLAALASAGCDRGPTSPGADGVRFAFPLVGELDRDFFYVNHVDLDSGPGILDYRCGGYTYDGHLGIDIVLPSFRRMDEGVTVTAAAPGVVAFVRDGLADRNTTWGPGGFGNHVLVDHGNDFVAYYAHLRRGSIAVAAGDSVRTGTPLGEVGSSGRSSMPHLHFEVQRRGVPLEPFSGPCGTGPSLWSVQHPYPERFGLIDADLATGELTLDRVKEPPPAATSVGVGERVQLWVQLQGVRAGTVSRWELVSPQGTTAAVVEMTHSTGYAMSWWWGWFAPTHPGEWRIDYRAGGEHLAGRRFTAEPAAPGENVAAGPASGSGGGALEVHPG
jgi:hypothetical protein